MASPRWQVRIEGPTGGRLGWRDVVVEVFGGGTVGESDGVK